jgi:hypothetical protein
LSRIRMDFLREAGEKVACILQSNTSGQCPDPAVDVPACTRQHTASACPVHILVDAGLDVAVGRAAAVQGGGMRSKGACKRCGDACTTP